MDLVKPLAPVILLLSLTLHAAGQDLSTAFATSYAAEARSDYSGAIAALRTNYAGTYEQNLRLGWLYFLAKNHTVSTTYYQKAVEQKPYALEPKFGLIKPLNAMNQVSKMLTTYQDILKIDPQNTQANYWVGVIFLNQKAYDKATRYFERVVNLYPFDYDANLSLAWCYLNLGRKNDARILYGKALLIRPNDATATAGLKQATQ